MVGQVPPKLGQRVSSCKPAYEGARAEGEGKESGDLSQHFVFSAGMWVEPMRLQQSHFFHSVIQRDSVHESVRFPSLQSSKLLQTEDVS